MKKTIDGIKYHVTEKGVLIPDTLLGETTSKITTSKDVVLLLADEANAEQERCIVFTLNAQHKVIKKHVVTIGLVNEAKIHPREVFRTAILDNACSIIVAHNHPSGNVEPSEADLIATKRLYDSSKILGITLLDHIIVGPPDSHSSIRDSHPYYFT